jgi:signal transduction histidine kinase
VLHGGDAELPQHVPQSPGPRGRRAAASIRLNWPSTTEGNPRVSNGRDGLFRSCQKYYGHSSVFSSAGIGWGTRARTRFDDDELDLMRTAAGLVSVAMQGERTPEQVEQHAAGLETSNAALEAFSYTLSRDVRAPIRASAGSAQMIEEDCPTLDAETMRGLGVIQHNGVKMRELIEALLAFSRLEQGSSIQRRLTGSASVALASTDGFFRPKFLATTAWPVSSRPTGRPCPRPEGWRRCSSARGEYESPRRRCHQ